MLLSSEYDRANPATSVEGFKDYMEFIKKEEERYNNASEAEKKEIEKKMASQNNRVQQKVRPPVFAGGSPFARNNAYMPPPQMMGMGFGGRPGFGGLFRSGFRTTSGRAISRKMIGFGAGGG